MHIFILGSTGPRRQKEQQCPRGSTALGIAGEQVSQVCRLSPWCGCRGPQISVHVPRSFYQQARLCCCYLPNRAAEARRGKIWMYSSPRVAVTKHPKPDSIKPQRGTLPSSAGASEAMLALSWSLGVASNPRHSLACNGRVVLSTCSAVTWPSPVCLRFHLPFSCPCSLLTEAVVTVDSEPL